MTRKQWATIVARVRDRYTRENRGYLHKRKLAEVRAEFDRVWPMLRRGWLFLPECFVRHENLPDGNAPTGDETAAKLDAHLRTYVECFEPREAIPLTWDPVKTGKWNGIDVVVLGRDPSAKPGKLDTVTVHASLWPALADRQHYLAGDFDGLPIVAVGAGMSVDAVVMPMARINPSEVEP